MWQGGPVTSFRFFFFFFSKKIKVQIVTWVKIVKSYVLRVTMYYISMAIDLRSYIRENYTHYVRHNTEPTLIWSNSWIFFSFEFLKNNIIFKIIMWTLICTVCRKPGGHAVFIVMLKVLNVSLLQVYLQLWSSF
jgi:hypothetical protein